MNLIVTQAKLQLQNQRYNCTKKRFQFEILLTIKPEAPDILRSLHIDFSFCFFPLEIKMVSHDNAYRTLSVFSIECVNYVLLEKFQIKQKIIQKVGCWKGHYLW